MRGCRFLLALLVMAMPSLSRAMDVACAPHVVSIQAAPGTDGFQARPTSGWKTVALPDYGSGDGVHDAVWYRIDWERGCAGSAEPVALGIDGVAMTGAVYSNEDLLWRDASLVEPLSRSWNMPRWWVLPESGLRPGVNSIWVYAVGPKELTLGMGALRLGSVDEVTSQYAESLWRQRTVYSINAVLCTMAGVLFLLIWTLRREETAYAWFALMALAWLAYLNTYLGGSAWPWPDSVVRARFSMIALIAYVLCACLFTFRHGGQKWPWVERALWLAAGVGAIAVVLVPREHSDHVNWLVWRYAMDVFLLNCLQFQFHAWWPRRGGRSMRHVLLALCWLVYLLVGVSNWFSVLDRWQVAKSWAALSGPLVIALVVLLLGAQLVQQVRSVERFNRDLEDGVTKAREELARALARSHAQALDHAKLQERLQIAHDLHDGLGGSLVRGMALVEQANQPLPNERVLSLLKVLRDDLRQVIDHGSSAGASVPETPVQWAAPLRHRFTRLFDELGVRSDWRIPAQWRDRPAALQCLGLTRLVEEALSNVIKHSRARNVAVECSLPEPDRLVLCVGDDGVGFDVLAVQEAGQSVGMRSMTSRAERIGGRLSVESDPAGTVVRVQLTPGDPRVVPGNDGDLG